MLKNEAIKHSSYTTKYLDFLKKMSKFLKTNRKNLLDKNLKSYIPSQKSLKKTKRARVRLSKKKKKVHYL